MYIGYDHAVRNLIPEADIIQHRLDYELDFSMTDDQLRHEIMYKRYSDVLYTNSLNLAEILHQCNVHNIVPIIALNFFYKLRADDNTKNQWVSIIPPEQFARCVRLTAGLIIGAGFKEAYLSVLNEPTKWLTNAQILHYSNATYDVLSPEQLNKIKIIVGNDEFFPGMYDLLARDFAGNKNILIGYHALSSMGTWGEPTKYIARIEMMKGLADNYRLKIIGNECGSWFKSYRTEAGHNINKLIARECKANGYIACCIVLPDINTNVLNMYKLGYRVWNNSYTTIKIYSSYFDDFINFIKEEGEKKMTEYNVPDELKAIADQLGNEVGNYSAGLPVLTGTGIWQNTIEHKRGDFLLKADFDAAVEKILKITGIDISVYYNSDGSWNNNWEDIAKSNPKP